MKNIALCISGYFSNKDGDDLMKTNYIYDNIINKIKPENNLYLFIHSFDYNNKNNILTKYPNITKYIIEPQIDFNTKLNEENREFINKYNYVTSWHSSLSYLYSRMVSIMLAINYSKENNIDYDLICWTRFDVGIRVKILNLGINCCKLVFDVNLDNQYVYSAFWKQLNAGFADFWFISNTSNMNLIANMYHYVLEKAFKLNSDYLLAFENWPDSNINDEFSNEILNDNSKLIKPQNIQYSPIYACNNHLLIKFYFMTNSLYNDCKFLSFS